VIGAWSGCGDTAGREGAVVVARDAAWCRLDRRLSPAALRRDQPRGRPPGVGAFDNAMKNINELDLLNVLNEKVLYEKVPILGICLGMQIMTMSSEEGTLKGLSWINAKSLSFKSSDKSGSLRIPHMGWNSVYPKSFNSLFYNLESDEMRFYFVHSYYVDCVEPENILSATKYGVEFASSMSKDNIYGVQFHPEKSHKFGMRILKNFVEVC